MLHIPEEHVEDFIDILRTPTDKQGSPGKCHTAGRTGKIPTLMCVCLRIIPLFVFFNAGKNVLPHFKAVLWGYTVNDEVVENRNSCLVASQIMTM